MDSLLRQSGIDESLEIIVVDNGSTDRTLEIVGNYASKIKIFVVENVTVSELRNFGAQNSSREWLAFIDADVEVDINWFGNLVDSVNGLEKNGCNISRIIIGSRCAIPDNPTWIEYIWFGQLYARDKSKDDYINTGNLIVSRNFFNTIGGFDLAYETGEDEKLCQDAKACGGRIVNQNSITTIHHGYPKSIRHFFKRERWHGLAMKNYLSQPWNYRDLLLSYYNIIVLVVFLSVMLVSKKVALLLIFLVLSLNIPLFLLAILRSKKKAVDVLLLTYLYIIYGWAKTFALIDIIKKLVLNKLGNSNSTIS